MTEKEKLLNDNKTVDIEEIIEGKEFSKGVNFKIHKGKDVIYCNKYILSADLKKRGEKVSLNLAKSSENSVLIRFLIGMMEIANNDASYQFYISWEDDSCNRFIKTYHWFNQMKITNEETHFNLVLKRKKEIVKLKNREKK